MSPEVNAMFFSEREAKAAKRSVIKAKQVYQVSMETESAFYVSERY